MANEKKTPQVDEARKRELERRAARKAATERAYQDSVIVHGPLKK